MAAPVMEGHETARFILDRFDQLKAARDARAKELGLIASLFRVTRNGFQGEDRKGFNLKNLYNSTTMQSAGNAVSSIYSTVAGSANQWFEASTADADLAEQRDAKVWFSIVTRRMRASFGPSMSNFSRSAVALTGDATILGTGGMVSDEVPGRLRFVDQAVSPADFVFATDAYHLANEMIVERRLTALQAAREYGPDALPERIRAILDEPARVNDQTRYRFLQAYQPNDEYMPGRLGRRGQAYLSTHVCEEGKTLVRQRGTFEQPFAIPRWMTDGDDDWGRGMGYINLASAMKLQIQERQNAQAGALAAEPPIGTTGARALKAAAKLSPGKFLHGAVSYSGQQLARPIFTFNGLPVSVDMARMAKEEVENGWHAALLSLVNRTGLGNLEVIERMEERLRLMAPYLGNLQSEWLAPILERRFAMLWRAGQIPPPPPVLNRAPLEMKFTSIAAMAHKAQEGVAAARVLEDTGTLAKMHPNPQEVWDPVDTDRAQAILREARGADPLIHRSPEAVAERRAQRAQADQARMAMEMAQAGAGVAKDAAQAGALAEGGG